MLAACHKFILRRKEVYPPFNHFQSYSADVKKCALYCNIFVKNNCPYQKEDGLPITIMQTIKKV